jgi:predicted DNA-binding protein YlxM (UPF0122 family)
VKIPKDIVTKYKIRDAKICMLYAKDALSMEEIALRFKISAPRVHQILYKNRHLLKVDREYEKVKRVNHLKRILKKTSDATVTKDAVDLLKELRSETEIKTEVGQQSGDTRVIIIRESTPSQPLIPQNSNGNTHTERQISGQVSVVRI